MQHKLEEYNPEEHDKFKALTVKQPYAGYLADGSKTIEVRSRPTKYRGNLLICSSANPVVPGMESGVTLGLVELCECKPIAEFTPEDWEKTRIPEEKRSAIKKGYGWIMKNPRRVVEMPMKGQLGIYTLVCDKDDIIEYPRVVYLDK